MYSIRGISSISTPGPQGLPSARYTRTAIWLHWLLGAALLGQIAFGFMLDEIAPRATPERSGVVNLHKSFGIVLGLLIAARLAWRLSHAPPPWPATMSEAERRAARAMHAALYVCMVVMPLSGYIASNFIRFGISFFGIAWPPWGPPLPSVYAFFQGVHVTTAVVFSALIVGHVLAALKHAVLDRDGVFARMLN
jgi:cytochrome b561